MHFPRTYRSLPRPSSHCKPSYPSNSNNNSAKISNNKLSLSWQEYRIFYVTILEENRIKILLNILKIFLICRLILIRYNFFFSQSKTWEKLIALAKIVLCLCHWTWFRVQGNLTVTLNIIPEGYCSLLPNRNVRLVHRIFHVILWIWFVNGPAENRTRVSSLQTRCSTIGLRALCRSTWIRLKC